MSDSGDDVIRSRHNPLIKRIRTLWDPRNRDPERLFIVEGLRAVEDAVAHGAVVESIVVSDDFDTDRLTIQAAAIPHKRVAADLFSQLADTLHPQGILAITRIPADLEAQYTENPLVLFLDGVGNPGNLGTLLRSAAAAGASAVYLLEHTTDLLNPKVVRAGMGAHFRIPAKPATSIEACLANYPEMQIVGCQGHADIWYDEVDFRRPTAIIVGSESRGISRQSQAAATHLVAIPMHAQTESLNAGVAGSIILFEANRQRRVRV